MRSLCDSLTGRPMLHIWHNLTNFAANMSPEGAIELPPFVCVNPYNPMIDKTLLREVIESELSSTDGFLVDLSVTPDNRITVEIDSPTGVDIDACVKLTRAIEARFDRDADDYELEVGSAGLTAPFKVRGQYEKNVGRDVALLTADGRKLYGRLVAVGDGEGMDFPFTVAVEEKVKEPGRKRPVTVERELTFTPADVKSIAYDIKFK